MSTAPINLTLYRLLVQLGASEADAEQAAKIDTSELATKADIAELRLAMAEMKAELIRWNVGTLLALAAIFGALKVLG